MKLSIITVNLNNLEGLKKTYESVVSQTFTDYEWLVIDGGSTDGSREFIEQHQDKFAYWCSERDKGIFNAMNKGIVRAKGEYLNFMNSGDCFACEETVAEVFGKNRTADILYGYSFYGSRDGTCCTTRLMKPTIKWYDLYSISFPHQSTFIRRTCFDIMGLYDEKCKIIADWKWFVVAILYKNASYEFLPFIIAICQYGGVSQTDKCYLELMEQRKLLFPNFITQEDETTLLINSIIQSSKVTHFLYRVIKLLAYQLYSFKKNLIIKHLYACANKK